MPFSARPNITKSRLSHNCCRTRWIWRTWQTALKTVSLTGKDFAIPRPCWGCRFRTMERALRRRSCRRFSSPILPPRNGAAGQAWVCVSFCACSKKPMGVCTSIPKWAMGRFSTFICRPASQAPRPASKCGIRRLARAAVRLFPRAPGRNPPNLLPLRPEPNRLQG